MNRRDAKLKEYEKELDERQNKLKDEQLALIDQNKEIEQRKMAVEQKVQEYDQKLEKVSGLTVEDAKKILMANMKSEAEHAAATMLRQIKEEAQRNAEAESLKIVTLAIERVTVDQVVDRTTTQFKLPDEGVKGRLIGHEGRNIKYFEELTATSS